MSIDVGPGGDPEKMDLKGPNMSGIELFPENFFGIRETDNRVIGSGEGLLPIGEAWKRINAALSRDAESDEAVKASELRGVISSHHLEGIRQSVLAVVDTQTNCNSYFPGPIAEKKAA